MDIDKKHMYDYKPFSAGRMACILEIWEQAYKFRRIPKTIRGIEHSPEWKTLIYKLKDDMDWDNGEILTCIEIMRNRSMKQIRQYLLENGSKIVRHGKRTYVRGRRKK